MDRNESANEGGSSPDTVIARSSSEEERNRFACSTSGEYVTVGDSSSSVDTVTSVGTTTNVATGDPPAADDKKKGRFGVLKSSFRKEGGLFKIRRKNRQLDESAAEPELDVEEKGLFIWLVPLSLWVVCALAGLWLWGVYSCGCWSSSSVLPGFRLRVVRRVVFFRVVFLCVRHRSTVIGIYAEESLQTCNNFDNLYRTDRSTFITQWFNSNWQIRQAI